MIAHLKNFKKLVIAIFATMQLMTLRLNAIEYQPIQVECSTPNFEPFIPDSAVNNVYFLDRPKAIKRVCETYNPTWNYDAALPYAIISNSKGDEYLKFIFHCGGTIYHAQQFEIGYVVNGENIVKTDDESFITNCEIRLGTTKQDLIDRIGEDYSTFNIGDTTIMHYSVAYEYYEYLHDFVYNSVEPYYASFLDRHNNVGYDAYYWIVDDKIVKIKFGFMYI